MAKVVPIRWQGATRTRDLRTLVLKQSLAWLQNWAAAPGDVPCSMECLAADPSSVVAPGCMWLSMSGRQGTLWWRTSPASIERIGCALARVEESDGKGLAAGIGRRALRDLSMQLAGGDKTTNLVDALLTDAGTLDPRHGVVGFCWVLDDVRMDLYLDPSLCSALAPPTMVPAQLTSRSDAIGPAQLTLRAVLDLGMASLDETLSLRPGEVIKTGVPLSQPVHVQTESGEIVFSGALVADESHRALRFTSHR